MPTEEVQGMMEILAKLNEAEKLPPTKAQQLKNEKNAPKPTILASVSKNAQGMLAILEKFDTATKTVAKEVLQESQNDVELSVMNKKGNKVTVGAYEVVLERIQVVPGMKKTFYTIKEGDDTLYEHISLFETAMGIVKGLLFEKQHKVDKLLDLDAKYANALTEAATHRLKAKSLNEAHMLDIVMAKQGQAISKMKSIKNQIKTTL